MAPAFYQHIYAQLRNKKAKRVGLALCGQYSAWLFGF
jgi:hypothetical protein